MRESLAFKSCMGQDMERNVGGIRNIEIRGSTSKRLFANPPWDCLTEPSLF